MEVGAKGPVFDWDTIFQMLRNGRCAQTVGPRSKIFSSEKPPYWVVLTPLSNQNSTENIYGPVSKFSHSYTLKLRPRQHTRKVFTSAHTHFFAHLEQALGNIVFKRRLQIFVVSTSSRYTSRLYSSQVSICNLLSPNFSILIGIGSLSYQLTQFICSGFKRNQKNLGFNSGLETGVFVNLVWVSLL